MNLSKIVNCIFVLILLYCEEVLCMYLYIRTYACTYNMYTYTYMHMNKHAYIRRISYSFFFVFSDIPLTWMELSSISPTLCILARKSIPKYRLSLIPT